jgi:hypothetical protein
MRAFAVEAVDTGPHCLADLLRDVTPQDIAHMHASVAGWTFDPLRGKEAL